MIPQRNLSLLSNQLARKGGRRIPETVLERDYCLSWFLIGLSYTPLKNILLFKGGTCIKKCYIPDYRFSEDLDFTLTEKFTFDKVLEYFEFAFKHIQVSSGIRFFFDHYSRHNHKNTYTFFLGYEGPLPGSSGKKVKVDITIKEKIVYPPEERIVLKGYKEYEDLPENRKIFTYSLNEIVIEKVVALLDRARNEPRDLYDIWYLISNKYVILAELIEALKKKWKFRGSDFPDIKEELQRKKSRFKKLWNIRLSSQVISLPEFNKVYRTVQRELRQAGLL